MLNMEPIYISTYKWTLTQLWLAATDNGISYIAFARHRSLDDFIHQLKRPVIKKPNAVLNDLHEQLDNYFSGALTSFQLPVDFLHGTPFQRRVWQAIENIAFGDTKTYSDIAHSIDHPLAVRAVGSACGANPVPVVIPCHRVLAKGGAPGGYGGGLDIKRALLQLEGVPV